MIEATLSYSNNPNKKYKVIVKNINNNKKKTIHFGARNYEDYTIHKDDMRKKQYIKRYQNNEDWNDPFTAGFWSKHLLWNKKTLQDSINDIHDKFGIKLFF